MSALVVTGLCKAFGATRALSDLSLSVEPGQVHAVLGENGAGKSTLMKILAGAERPDAGSMLLAGRDFRPKHPDAARRRGVALVPQEPELAGDLSVGENVLLGAEPTRFGFVSRRALRQRAERALLRVSHQGDAIDPAAPARSLSASDRQRVVIARALAVEEPKVLILDEPTSSLTAADSAQLFAVIGELERAGIAILYVSHFLEEVMQIADSYSVLRDGRNAGSGRIADTSIDELVAQMAGKALATERREAPVATATDAIVDAPEGRARVVLSVRGLAGRRLPKAASLELHAGEVLGIAGLVGAGRSELLRCIFGLDPVRSGELRVGVHLGPASPLRRLAQGVGMLSEDRKGEGLALGLSIAENIVSSRRLLRGALIDTAEERRAAARLVERLHVQCRDVEQAVGELSGGNQQKVALARLLHHDVDVLLLDEPTRGIDVKSRADVHAVIRELAARGRAVLLVSSYLPELFAVCERIAVMSRGRLGPARPTRELDERGILKEALSA